jgi:hypothetical protein
MTEAPRSPSPTAATSSQHPADREPIVLERGGWVRRLERVGVCDPDGLAVRIGRMLIMSRSPTVLSLAFGVSTSGICPVRSEWLGSGPTASLGQTLYRTSGNVEAEVRW